MLRLLLDANLSPTVTTEVRRHRPDCLISDLHIWDEGRYLSASDETILAIAADEGLTLVTRDVRTIAPLLAIRHREGRAHAGTIFLDHRSFPEGNVGAVVHAIVALWDRESESDFRDRVLYLERGT